MVQYIEGERAHGKGHKLFTVTFLPDTATPTAVLCFHHGVGEHIGRYKESEPSPAAGAAPFVAWGVPWAGGGPLVGASCFAQPASRQPPRACPLARPPPNPATASATAVFSRFADAGIAVYSGDVVGHGKSEGHRAYIDSYAETVRPSR